jgi:hypothetical protein
MVRRDLGEEERKEREEERKKEIAKRNLLQDVKDEHGHLHTLLASLRQLDKIAENDIRAKMVRIYRQYGYDGYGWYTDDNGYIRPTEDLEKIQSKLRSLNEQAEAEELQAKLDLKERNKIQMRAKEAELEEEDYQNRLYSNKIDRKKKSAKPKPKRKVVKKCKCK